MLISVFQLCWKVWQYYGNMKIILRYILSSHVCTSYFQCAWLATQHKDNHWSILIHHCDKAELPTGTTTNITCSSPSASEHKPQAFQYQRKIEAKYSDCKCRKETHPPLTYQHFFITRIYICNCMPLEAFPCALFWSAQNNAFLYWK